MLNWNSTKEDSQTITKIAERANAMANKPGGKYPMLDASMDIAACHLNGCPLRLKDLLAADDGNFAHDVFGIRQYIDRNTGKLQGCFDPRYSQPAPVQS